MLATLISSGSAAAWTQTESGAAPARSAGRRSRARSGPSRCAAAARRGGRRPPGRRCAGSSRRGRRSRRRPRAPDEQLGAGADEGRLGGPAAEAEAGREQLAQRAEQGRRDRAPRGVDRRPRGRARSFSSSAARSARPPPRPPPRIARRAALRIVASPLGCGSSSGRARRRAAPERPPARHPCGGPRRDREGQVGASRRPARGAPRAGPAAPAGTTTIAAIRAPLRSKANPPTQTGPAPAGSSSGSSANRAAADLAHSRRSSNRAVPRETASCADAEPRPGRSRGRAAPSRTSGRPPAGTRTPSAHGSEISTSAVTLTSLRAPPASSSPRSRAREQRRGVDHRPTPRGAGG